MKRQRSYELLRHPIVLSGPPGGERGLDAQLRRRPDEQLITLELSRSPSARDALGTILEVADGARKHIIASRAFTPAAIEPNEARADERVVDYWRKHTTGLRVASCAAWHSGAGDGGDNFVALDGRQG